MILVLGRIFGFWAATAVCLAPVEGADASWRVGVSKVDITPTEPLRLSGYSNRQQSHTGVTDPLHVRVLTLKNKSPSPGTEHSGSRSKPLVLISFESICVHSGITNAVAKTLRTRHGIPRSHIVISSTHCHTAPTLPGGLENIFSAELTDDETAAAQRYLDRVIEVIEHAVDNALSNPVADAHVDISEGTSDFAVQRRLVRDGKWAGFGVQQGGQIDHRVFVLRVTAADGSLVGVAYQYACHCTSLGPSFNQITGDWAGLSASRLEELNPGAIFLPIIGCGADANPEPRDSYEAAVQNGLKMVDSMQRVLVSEQWHPLPAPTNVQFGNAGLEPEHPTQDQLREAAASDDVNRVRWSKRMQEILAQMGRLPESIPLPVHVWKFGDALSWVFLGGEVVVEYQHAIEKELPTRHTWVAAYCDDVPAYVASEAQRAEGGYEVDYSMIFYLQPGRWKSGTQSSVVSRVREISQQDRSPDEPLDPQSSLKTMRVPEGYVVELVAAEPLIQDPVNIAFGWDGRVWVAQMSDYPTGGQGGGSIRVLADSDGDGTLDQASTFLSGLSYPTSVYPWRNGAIVIAAPNIIFAEDTDGDGVSDQQRILISGIHEANPQHRASGFEIGLDGRLHFGVGDGTRELLSHVNEKTYQTQGNDVAWNPDTGEIEVLYSGKTQFVPTRDAYGNWFGNENSFPLYQFVFFRDQLQGRHLDNGNVHQLLSPPVSPPVFPRSRTNDRFNDTYTRDRFTSACSSIIARVDGLRPANKTADSSHPIALVCEPVHNLVARLQLYPDGSVFSARRHPEDAQYDFFTSTDPWSRPVRAVNAPDGSVWIVDMYRYVIEHPEWIPTAWQEKIDLRAGEGLGRIYRVYHHLAAPKASSLPNSPASIFEPFRNLSKESLIDLLQSSNGAVLDLTTQAIVTDQASDLSPKQIENHIRELLNQPQSPEVAASLLGILKAKRWLHPTDLSRVLTTSDNPQLIGWALKLAAQIDNIDEPLNASLESLLERNLGPAVDLQWVLASQKLTGISTETGIVRILNHKTPDRWMTSLLTSIATPQLASSVLQVMLDTASRANYSTSQLQDHITTVRRLLGLFPRDDLIQLFEHYFPEGPDADWNPGSTLLLVGLSGLLNDTSSADREVNAASKRFSHLIAQATVLLLDSNANETQRHMVSLMLGNQLIAEEREKTIIETLLAQGEPASTIASQRVRYVSADDLAGRLLAHWNQLSSQNRSVIANALMIRPAWRETLINGLETSTIQPNELPPSVVQSLTTHYDRNLRSRAVAVIGQPTPRQPIVNDYLLRMPNPSILGDTTRGEQLYREHCDVCHTGKDGKAAVGPPLYNLQHWNNQQWVVALLDPSQAVEDKFKQTILQTFDGEVFGGIVIEETADILNVVTSDGTVRTVSAKSIENRNLSTVSLMPEGFETRITPEQLADLVQYLKMK